jgi:glutaredoxin 3
MKRRIEIFSAGCDLCKQTIELVSKLAGPENDIVVHDMRQADNVKRAHGYGVRNVPSVVIDEKLAGCCTGSGPDEQVLRDALR